MGRAVFNPSKPSTEPASMTNSSECTHESAVLGLLVFSSVTQGNMVTSWDHLSPGPGPGAEELHHFQGGLLDPQQQQERTVACWQLHKRRLVTRTFTIAQGRCCFSPKRNASRRQQSFSHSKYNRPLLLFHQVWSAVGDQRRSAPIIWRRICISLSAADLPWSASCMLSSTRPAPSKHTPPQYPLSPPNMCEFIEFLE